MKDNKFKNSTEIEKVKSELAEITNDLQRTRADFENYRKNTEFRISNAQSLGEKKAILAILPFLDDIERAISHLPKDLEGNVWVKNVVNMSKNIEKNLSKIGIEKINSNVGISFNPEFHEAIQFDDEGNGEEIITDELRAGYLINGDVLRHSMVKVGRSKN